ncbi:dihydrolipoyllysine-residue acetyltransferase [Candidatus Curculioniphilus buchneri]|uniref:dihydrolipoyllysine-residue acetyltransferase n=1 Tax=Candidatus Curculioniphilus buchneri TaxID=690594 RepID=UPI00376EFCA4
MAIKINVPDIGTDEVEVTEILVNVGDQLEAEQSLITVEGDKTTMEIPTPVPGIIKEIKINIGDKINTGSLIVMLEETSEMLTSQSEKDNKNTLILLNRKDQTTYIQNTAIQDIAHQCSHATPVIRRLARKFCINLNNLKGTGRKGRILREDIHDYIRKAIKLSETFSTEHINQKELQRPVLPWPKIDFSKFGDTEEITLDRIRKLSGANLYRNWISIPHVTQFEEADITEIESFRNKKNAEIVKKKLNIKITFLIFIMKAVAKALKELPRFNSSLSEDGQILILKKYINIGIAIDTKNGLVVPVFRDINQKGIIELSYELAKISKKAREGKLTSLDMQGGCFTISSLGGIGGIAFTPIINAPEVAILGISKAAMKPVWNGKKFISRLMLPLSLSYDHRVIDGADGARFITFISHVISDIRHLIM